MKMYNNQNNTKYNKFQEDTTVLANIEKEINSKSENISKNGRNRFGTFLNKKLKKIQENIKKDKEFEMAKLRKGVKRLEAYILFQEKMNKENITSLNEELELEKQKEIELVHERENLKKMKEMLNMNDSDKEELIGRNNINAIISLIEGNEETDERICNKQRSEIKILIGK